jgi:hypothetical protein
MGTLPFLGWFPCVLSHINLLYNPAVFCIFKLAYFLSIIVRVYAQKMAFKINGTSFMKYTFTIVYLLCSITTALAQKIFIPPGQPWPDQNGNHVQAHGGGIIKIRKTYYWYGEERRQGLDPNLRYVSCYSSKDLVAWTFQKDVVRMADPENLGAGWILERPKVYYRANSNYKISCSHLLMLNKRDIESIISQFAKEDTIENPVDSIIEQASVDRNIFDENVQILRGKQAIY